MRSVVKHTLDSLRVYRTHSLLVRHYAVSLAILLVPLVFSSLMVYMNTRNSLQEESRARTVNELARITDMTDGLLTDVVYQTTSISLLNETWTYLVSGPAQPFFTGAPLQIVRRMTETYSLSNQLVHSIYVFSDAKDEIVTPYGVYPRTALADQGWFEIYRLAAPDSLTRSVRYINGSWPPVITITKIVSPSGSAQKLGAVVANIDIRRLRRLLTSSGDADRIYILDDTDTVIFSQKYDELGLRADSIDLGLTELRDRGAGGIYHQELRAFLASADSASGPWTYLLLHSDEMYGRSLARTTSVFILFVIVTFVLFSIATLFVAVNAYMPIQRMVDLIQDRSSDLPGAGGTNNELRLIASNVSQLITSNRELEAEVSSQLNSLEQTRYVALQSQINPHFLYNTLETINWEAMRLTKGENNVSAMISALSKCIRSGMASDADTVSLAQEVEHARLYLSLMSLRFPDRFTVSWKIPEDLLECTVPRVMLQPILENSVTHGFSTIDWTGEIGVEVVRQNSTVEVTVSDNGIGMSNRETLLLNRELRTEYTLKRNHIGLRNIAQRIRSLYGESYGCRVMSRKGFGTDVVTWLPLRRQHSDHPAKDPSALKADPRGVGDHR